MVVWTMTFTPSWMRHIRFCHRNSSQAQQQPSQETRFADPSNINWLYSILMMRMIEGRKYYIWSARDAAHSRKRSRETSRSECEAKTKSQSGGRKWIRFCRFFAHAQCAFVSLHTMRCVCVCVVCTVRTACHTRGTTLESKWKRKQAYDTTSLGTQSKSGGIGKEIWFFLPRIFVCSDGARCRKSRSHTAQPIT